jgi:hypothetical protein
MNRKPLGGLLIERAGFEGFFRRNGGLFGGEGSGRYNQRAGSKLKITDPFFRERAKPV